MKQHLGEINFKDKIATYVDIKGNYLLRNLSKVNLFIGANNSGKSRFLRELFSNDEYSYLSDGNYSLPLINSKIEEYNKSIISTFYMYQIRDVESFTKQVIPIKEGEIHKRIPTLFKEFKRLSKFVVKTFVTQRGYKLNAESNEGKQTASLLRDSIRKCANLFLKELELIYSDVSFKKCYIPVLRGLRPIGDKTEFNQSQYPYVARTIRDYFKENKKIKDGGASIDIFCDSILTGLNFYEDCKKMLLGATSERRKVRKFESFLSKYFFNGREVNIIPRVEKDGKDTNIVYLLIDKEERPIHNFGDGIQSVIMLTYHMFFNKDKHLCYFIEEPDLYLHPGYQRVFLNLLSSNEFPNHQFFITTHSNHFLDFTMDTDNISIYTFKKESKEEYVFENVSSGDMKTLELLGVRNSSVFLSNCTIWVEGITDRLYIRKFLELYYKKHTKTPVFLEDIHYSFLEYGGGNITHWSFLDAQDSSHPNIDVDRLCGKLFLVTDNDGAGLKQDGSEPSNPSAKRLRHKKLKRKLGKRYYCLKSREIENALPENTIKEVLKSYNEKNWDKDLSRILHSRYKDEKLGKFIDESTKGLSRKFADKSGTVNDKVNFCKKAINNLHDYDELTSDAKDLTKKIIAFLKENNS